MKKTRVLNPTIGADIEYFLKHRASGKFISAEGYIMGTKHEPFNFDPVNRFFATSLDNVAAEICIPPVPITDREGFIKNILYTLDYVNRTIPPELCTVAIPAAIMDDDQLQTENAQAFGCEPDFCVWNRTVNSKPSAIDEVTGQLLFSPNLRSGGGHIHIGYENPNEDTSERLVKAMDLCVGVPSVLQEPDNERKRLYGKAGSFRFKEQYGVEYRTVSNYYADSPRLIDWVARATQKAIDMVNADFDVDAYADRIIDSINNNNKVAAQTLINELELEMA